MTGTNERTEEEPERGKPLTRVMNALQRLGRGVGGVVGTIFQAGRDSVDTLIRTVIPFLAFVSLIVGIINHTGIGDLIADTLSPLASTLPGLIVLTVIVALPFLSPILGPGAVIAQVIGVLLGEQIARGAIPPQYALPALFAINPQVGCDFVPVGLALGEAEPETVETGVPAVLISRLFTGPAATIIAFFASAGLFSDA